MNKNSEQVKNEKQLKTDITFVTFTAKLKVKQFQHNNCTEKKKKI